VLRPGVDGYMRLGNDHDATDAVGTEGVKRVGDDGGTGPTSALD